MDYKLTSQIIGLIKSLKTDEHDVFSKSGKGNPYYIEAYKIILKGIVEEKSKEQIAEDMSSLKCSLNDVKENLRDKLVEFISKAEEKNDVEQYEISEGIKAVTSLINRDQTELAIEILLKIYKKLKKTKANGTNYHLYLQYLNLVLVLQSKRYDSVTRSIPDEFEGKEVIEWLNRLAKGAVSYLAPNNLERSSEDFKSNLLFFCLVNYLKSKKYYEEVDSLFSSNGGSDIFANFTSSNDQATISTFNILRDLYKLELAVKLNYVQEVKYLLQSLENNSFYFQEKHYQTYIFLILQIYEFRLNLEIDTKQFKIFSESDNILELNAKDINLLTEKELGSVALRIEINKGLVYLLSRKFENAYEHFSSIPLTVKMDLELKYYIKLFEALAYRICHSKVDLNKFYEKLEIIKNLKYQGTEYSKEFFKFLKNNADGKNFLQGGKEFKSQYVPKSLFEKVCSSWLDLISQPN